MQNPLRKILECRIPQELGGGWVTPCQDSQPELLNAEGKARRESTWKAGRGWGVEGGSLGPGS